MIIYAVKFTYKLNKENVVTDTKTLCPIDGVKKRTIVLIDKTDTFTPLRATSIRTKIEKIKYNLEKYENIQIFTVGDISRNIRKPLINVCNPGEGKDANFLYQCPACIQNVWQNDFSEKVDIIVDNLATPEGSEKKQSPIFESIESISVTSLDSSIATKFYIFSDFIQNVSNFSQYTDPYPYNFEKFMQTEYGKKSKTELHQATIYMYVFKERFLRKELDFWNNWFYNSNGSVHPNWEPVP